MTVTIACFLQKHEKCYGYLSAMDGSIVGDCTCPCHQVDSPNDPSLSDPARSGLQHVAQTVGKGAPLNGL